MRQACLFLAVTMGARGTSVHCHNMLVRLCNVQTNFALRWQNRATVTSSQGARETLAVDIALLLLLEFEPELSHYVHSRGGHLKCSTFNSMDLTTQVLFPLQFNLSDLSDFQWLRLPEDSIFSHVHEAQLRQQARQLPEDPPIVPGCVPCATVATGHLLRILFEEHGVEKNPPRIAGCFWLLPLFIREMEGESGG